MEPVPLLRSLRHSVQAALDAGHVGVPLFVRCVAHVAPAQARLPEALRQVAAVAGAWLGAPPRRVYVQGGTDAGQITASVQYVRGESALLCVNPTLADGVPRVDLMLLGNTGALYHEGSALSAPQIAAAGAPSGELPALPEPLWQAMEESLRTGQAVEIAPQEPAERQC